MTRKRLKYLMGALILVLGLQFIVEGGSDPYTELTYGLYGKYADVEILLDEPLVCRYEIDGNSYTREVNEIFIFDNQIVTDFYTDIFSESENVPLIDIIDLKAFYIPWNHNRVRFCENGQCTTYGHYSFRNFAAMLALFLILFYSFFFHKYDSYNSESKYWYEWDYVEGVKPTVEIKYLIHMLQDFFVFLLVGLLTIPFLYFTEIPFRGLQLIIFLLIGVFIIGMSTKFKSSELSLIIGAASFALASFICSNLGPWAIDGDSSIRVCIFLILYATLKNVFELLHLKAGFKYKNTLYDSMSTLKYSGINNFSCNKSIFYARSGLALLLLAIVSLVGLEIWDSNSNGLPGVVGLVFAIQFIICLYVFLIKDKFDSSLGLRKL